MQAMDLLYERLLNLDDGLSVVQGCSCHPIHIRMQLFDLVTRAMYATKSNMIHLQILRELINFWGGLPKFDVVSYINHAQHVKPLQVRLRRKIVRYLRVGLNKVDLQNIDVEHKDLPLSYVLNRIDPSLSLVDFYSLIKGFNLEKHRRVSFRVEGSLRIKCTHGHRIMGITSQNGLFRIVKGIALHYTRSYNRASIINTGLRRLGRANVHLTLDETPHNGWADVAFMVDLERLAIEVGPAYINENGVCLVPQGQHVPPSCLLGCFEVATGKRLWPGTGSDVMYNYHQQRELREASIARTCFDLCKGDTVVYKESAYNDLELCVEHESAHENVICCLGAITPCSTCMAVSL